MVILNYVTPDDPDELTPYSVGMEDGLAEADARGSTFYELASPAWDAYADGYIDGYLLRRKLNGFDQEDEQP